MSSISPLSRLEDDKESRLTYDIMSDALTMKARTSMLAFTRAMNPNFRINWHHVRICQALDRFVRGEISRLMIFVQPQVGKSELVSRHLPAFIFGHDPDHRIISATYGDSFASEFNIDVQRVMESDDYKTLFPRARIAEIGMEGRWVRNSSRFDIVGQRGRYHSVGVGGSLTGKTGYTLIIDDPVKSDEDVRSPTYREKQWRWFKTVARTRLRRDGQGHIPRILLTMTRWHHDDLAARILAEAKANPNIPQWTIVSFPALRETLEDQLDPRALDEPLWPEMVSKEDCEELKADSRTWNSLYQQRPAPEKGQILNREWWRFYGGPGQPKLPLELQKYIQSWDLTFTEGPSTDFVVGQVWARKGADKYLIDQFRGRAGFKKQTEAIQRLSAQYPGATGKYIEKAANGHAIQETLRTSIAGIILVPPKGSKIVRAEAVASQVEAGNVWLPDPSIAPWVTAFIEECAEFPFGKNDDQVDAFSQAVIQLTDSKPTTVVPISITGPSKWTKY